MIDRMLISLTAWMLAAHAMAQYDLYVSLLKDGTLEETVEAITEGECYTVTSMKVNGPINGRDMMFIRDLCGVKDLDTTTEGKLVTLDLTDAYVVASPDVYLSLFDVDFTSKDGHFGSGFLYNCSRLREVMLPVGTVAIDTLAFANCAALTELMIPPEVYSIGYRAFYGCASISYLALPDFVTTVEDGAFQNMDSLEELVLGNAVTTLDHAAIQGDDRLQNIYLGRSFRQYSPDLFYRSPSLQNINVTVGNPWLSSIDGVLFSASGDSLLAFPPASVMAEYDVPEGVRHIAPYAFGGCVVPVIYLGDQVEHIGEMAFFHASTSQIILGKGVQSIGRSVVEGCSSLRDVVCHAVPEDSGMAEEAFLDSEGSVRNQCVLYVLPGTADTMRRKRGFCDSEGVSYFKTVEEIVGADMIVETPYGDSARPADGLRYYDSEGRVAGPHHQGFNIVVMPDGKAAKYFKK